ncbi:MAG: SGNH/GDSL hydrolase family protein, partial [Ilumatobacter sp.]|nr:SGNH/GDSL hydrolase family protein [Ilumatobacter sp.]
MAGRAHQRRPAMSRLRLALVGVVALSTLTVAVNASTPHGVVEAAPRQIDIFAPGPLGAVTVFGDSVLLGSALWGPTLPERLAERGWGPIKFRAGEGYNTRTGKFGARTWLSNWRTQGWDAPNVLINLGANDSGICDTNINCVRQRIQGVIDEIGPGHTIWWPQITRLFTALPQQNTWNQALQEFANTRNDFFTWDWPAELPQYRSSDGTHLTADGYRTRSVRMANLFTRDVARASEPPGDPAPLPTANANPATFVPITGVRVIDTREEAAGPLTPRETRVVDFEGITPENASAVALYVGAAKTQSKGYFAARPCGSSTSGSTVNYPPSTAIGAPTIVALGEDDDVCVYSSGTADLVIDIQGAFVDGTDGMTFQPLATPDRLVDTRKAGRSNEVVVPVPAGAGAVAVNLTATGAQQRGFLSAYPCGQAGGVANLNFRPGSAWSASAIVNVSEADTICVSSSVSTDVIVDITGTFAVGAGLRYVPVTPTRMLDTRDGTGGWFPIHGAGQTIGTRVAPPSAQAVTGTITMVRPLDRGYVTADACSGSARTSSANAAAGAVIANSVTLGISDT